MLEVRINENETMVNVCGKPTEVMTDIVVFLKVIYERLSKDGKEFFNECLEDIVKEKIYTKTHEELEEINKKKLEEEKKKADKEIEDILNKMPEDLKELLIKLKGLL